MRSEVFLLLAHSFFELGTAADKIAAVGVVRCLHEASHGGLSGRADFGDVSGFHQRGGGVLSEPG